MSTSSYILKVYLIHEEGLRFREANMNQTLKALRICCDKINIGFRTVMVTRPNTDALQKNVKEIQEKIKYEKVSEEEFNQRMHMLSMEMISNLEKHKEAWSQILHEEDPRVISMVLEDDAFLMPEFAENLSKFLQVLPTYLLGSSRQWDICFLGSTKQDASVIASDDLTFLDTRTVGKILPSKESYVITPHIVRRMMESLSTIRYTLRTHLSWFLHEHPEIRSVFPTKTVFLDGSKIGICTSTIHPMNPLLINKEFMELWHMQKKLEIPLSDIRSLYKRVEHLRSPDMLHLYGRLLAERGHYTDAEDVFIDAIRRMREQNGILSPASQLLQDAVNNAKNLQRDREELSTTPSKYTVPDMA